MIRLKYRFVSIIVSFVIVTVLGFTASAMPIQANQPHSANYQRYAKVLIYNTTKDVEQRLLADGFEIEDITPEGNFEAYVSAENCNMLTSDGFSWMETIHDVSEYFVQRFHDSPADLLEGYPSVAETYDSLDLYASERSDLVAQKIIIGYSLQNRPIYAVKVTHNPSDTSIAKPEVFYNSLIHAREAITHTQLLYFIRYLINNYDSNTRVQNILDNRVLWFVPVVNPDGVIYNETTNPNGGGMWRKNRHVNTGGAYGVDLNRNFDSHWGYDNVGSSNNPASDTYRGDSAASEPETQVMQNFQIAHHFRITIDYHSYSNDIIIPLSYRRAWAPDHQLFFNMSHKLVDPISYAVGNVWWSLYPANGDGGEWQYLNSPDTARNFAVVIEIGSINDNFWPAQSRILPLCQSMVEPNLKAAEFAGEPRIVLPPPVPRVTTDTVATSDLGIVSWTIDTPSTINPAVNYDLRAAPAYTIGTETFDSTSSSNWSMSYVTIDTLHRVSGHHAAKFQNTNSVKAILQSKYPIKINATDTLSYRIWYSTETNYDYVFAQISTDDGLTWYSLPSDITVTTNPNIDNWDYGITGTSNSQFVLSKSSLATYANKSALFRFLYWTDAGTLGSGVWVDDISPSVLTPNPWTVRNDSLAAASDAAFTSSGQWLVQVRARDAQGDTSAWSIPKWITVNYDNVKTANSNVIPNRFALLDAYPNPFNPTTTIRYSTDRDQNISVMVYAIDGRKVATLTNGRQISGEHHIVWSGRDDFGVPVATGMYIVRLQSATQATAMKVVLVK